MDSGNMAMTDGGAQFVPTLEKAGIDTLQGGIDQVSMAAAITKWSHRVNRPQDMARRVAHAIRIAATAPMCPVFLNIPIDVGFTPFADPGDADTGALIIDSPRLPSRARIADLADALATAARPIVLAGSDAWYGDAGDALCRFVEVTVIPVFSDFVAHGLIPTDPPLYGGTGHKLAYVGDARPDLVIALGRRFGLFTLGKAELLFPASATVAHIAKDDAAIGRIRRADIAIIASAESVLDALIDKGDLAPAIAAALSSFSPACIDLRVDFNPIAPELGLMMSQSP